MKLNPTEKPPAPRCGAPCEAHEQPCFNLLKRCNGKHYCRVCYTVNPDANPYLATPTSDTDYTLPQ